MQGKVVQMPQVNDHIQELKNVLSSHFLLVAEIAKNEKDIDKLKTVTSTLCEVAKTISSLFNDESVRKENFETLQKTKEIESMLTDLQMLWEDYEYEDDYDDYEPPRRGRRRK